MLRYITFEKKTFILNETQNMGFYSFWSVTGSIVTKAVGFGSKVLKPVLNGITNIANVVKDTARVLSLVPIIGAVSSQIGAAANIISSVSSAGVEIIDVGEWYVSKHNAPEPSVPFESDPIVEEPSEVHSSPPLFIPATMSPNVSPGSNVSQAPAIFNVLPPSNSVMAPTFAPIIPKSNVSYPGRRILPMRRPSARKRQVDEVEELSERLSFLDIGSSVPKRLKTGGLYGGGGGRERGQESAPWLRV